MEIHDRMAVDITRVPDKEHPVANIDFRLDWFHGSHLYRTRMNAVQYPSSPPRRRSSPPVVHVLAVLATPPRQESRAPQPRTAASAANRAALEVSRPRRSNFTPSS